MLPDSSSGRHGREDPPKTIYEASFLVDADDWSHRNELADTIGKLAQLFGRSNVSTEDNNATGLYVLDEFPRVSIDLRAREANAEQLADLLFKCESFN
jgi:hypothetical protein